jgi:DNA-binding IclR family transcriptional regulator
MSRAFTKEYGASLSETFRAGTISHSSRSWSLLDRSTPQLSQVSARANWWATLQAAARRILWELWKSTQETVNLAVLDHGTVLYVDVMESPHELRISSRVGARRSLHITALGKALAAFLPAEPRESILSTNYIPASDS